LIAAFLASVIGAFFGSAIQTSRPRPLVIHPSVCAGALATVIGGSFGVLPGFILASDMERTRSLEALAYVGFFALTLEVAIPWAIAATVIARRIIRRRWLGSRF
jgi:hypothetical protein